MVVVPAGSFTMGGPTEIEQPQQTVTIAMPFAVSKYEVTFADWDACVAGGGCNGYEPKRSGLGSRPAAGDQRQLGLRAGIRRLARAGDGNIYRLLSEASTNIRRAPERPRSIRGATTSSSTDRQWPTAKAAAANGTASRPRRSDLPPNKLDCTICWAIFGNGLRIALTTLTTTRRRTARSGLRIIARRLHSAHPSRRFWLATGDLPRSALRNAFATVFRYDYVGL